MSLMTTKTLDASLSLEQPKPVHLIVLQQIASAAASKIAPAPAAVLKVALPSDNIRF